MIDDLGSDCETEGALTLVSHRADDSAIATVVTLDWTSGNIPTPGALSKTLLLLLMKVDHEPSLHNGGTYVIRREPCGSRPLLTMSIAPF